MVIFCIGTPAISGDSVAPITGDLLIEMGVNAFVYGTTARPITGSNYKNYLKFVRRQHANDTVIAIDSALGKTEDIGTVKVVKGGVKPGGALGKNHAKIGTLGILAQVGSVEKPAMAELMNVPHERAAALAKRCAKLVLKMLDEEHKERVSKLS